MKSTALLAVVLVTAVCGCTSSDSSRVTYTDLLEHSDVDAPSRKWVTLKVNGMNAMNSGAIQKAMEDAPGVWDVDTSLLKGTVRVLIDPEVRPDALLNALPRPWTGHVVSIEPE